MHFFTFFEKIQIQHLLKLNISSKDSTNFIAKIQIQHLLKLNLEDIIKQKILQHSNTTFVKVKSRYSSCICIPLNIIQIQHLLKLNPATAPYKREKTRIQIQHLLKLNRKSCFKRKPKTSIQIQHLLKLNYGKRNSQSYF